jgi:glyoxylase-like metal-dependent hydrolase (beta-lactamase superfamily II)
MGLKKISSRILYYPHQSKTDRPLLAYIKGDKMSLSVDAGNSADHVDEFYKALACEGLKLPDVTVITHWHWDHTYGMHHIHGISIACRKTNEFLQMERNKLADSSYVRLIKEEDECLGREYKNNKRIIVTLSDIEFEKDLVLNLGGMTAKVFHAESPHSEDSVFVYIPKERVLFLGDSTSEDFYNHGYMDQDKLHSLIKMIESIDCQYCILGHSEPLTKYDLLSYLQSIISEE